MDPAPTFKNNNYFNIFGIAGQFLPKSASVNFNFFENFLGRALIIISIFMNFFEVIFALEVVAASGWYCRKWPLQVVKKAASGWYCCKWPLQVVKKLQVVDIAASGRCRWLLQVACCNW